MSSKYGRNMHNAAVWTSTRVDFISDCSLAILLLRVDAYQYWWCVKERGFSREIYMGRASILFSTKDEHTLGAFITSQSPLWCTYNIIVGLFGLPGQSRADVVLRM